MQGRPRAITAGFGCKPPSLDYLRLPSVDITEGGPKRSPGTEAQERDCGRDTHYWAPTGSPEAVARLRFPQNVACGFPAPRSSVVVSQLSLLFAQVSFPWSADLLIE